MDGKNEIHTNLNSNLMKKYKEQGIDVEKAREDIINYFRNNAMLDKLHAWDKEYYHTVYTKEYYNKMVRGE